MPELSSSEKMGIALAGAIVLLSIISILVYVYAGAGLLFYLVATASVIIGFYIAYLVSKMEEGPASARKK